MDVDGVLLIQPEIAPSDAVPLQDPLFDDDIGFMFPAHGRLLQQVLEKADIIWVSSHHEEANRHIGPALGLPPLDWVHLAGAPRPRSTCSDLNAERIGAIDNYFQGHPVVWVDDNTEKVDADWARERDATGDRTLIISPDSNKGLQVPDIETMLWWLGQLDRA